MKGSAKKVSSKAKMGRKSKPATGGIKKASKAKGSQRMLLCDGARGWAEAKNRLSMPEQIEMSWQDYQQFIDGVESNG